MRGLAVIDWADKVIVNSHTYYYSLVQYILLPATTISWGSCMGGIHNFGQSGQYLSFFLSPLSSRSLKGLRA